MTVKQRQRVDSWQRLIELIDSRQPKDVIAALRERERRLTEGWKNQPKNQSSLAWLIQSDYPIRDVATLLRGLYRPRRRGKPGGACWRWTRPHYLVAWLVENQPRAERTDKLITAKIRTINGWWIMRGKMPLDPEPGSRDHERVKALLHGSKRRRL
jgi:hypothetical protein